MASTSSVDGLVSGLDTTTIISQLMAIEKQPQDALKTKQSDANTMVAVYQALNTKFAAIQVNIPEVRLGLSPGTAEVRPGRSLRLKPKLEGCSGNADVIWKLTPERAATSLTETCLMGLYSLTLQVLCAESERSPTERLWRAQWDPDPSTRGRTFGGRSGRASMASGSLAPAPTRCSTAGSWFRSARSRRSPA